ncbi:MAG: ribosome assembly cofactor RimP [Sphingobacterium sp.]|jgi:ribosome maturation factor RimP|uniref:Ribosome maturation factor RimP n=1 Tax=Sphingobacterium tabacisoli TaxID=2044855 RepID=A0ABW5L0J6_9SPHI|nr:ribosome assembly cofactor RimP [Sphingobacterium tabacisoli]MDR2282899.1 ribosome assembly cofactor RimP [Sphingobacterium sp.]
MQVEQRVKELVEEKIADRADLFVVRIKMLKNGVLEILLDGDEGISIEDCVAVSRHVGFHLEEENAIEKAYRLEVSSPGIDTGLLMPRQYVKNIGRNVRIKLEDGTKREGKLISATESEVVIEEIIKEKGKKAETNEVIFSMDKITETKVLISFN